MLKIFYYLSNFHDIIIMSIYILAQILYSKSIKYILKSSIDMLGDLYE